MLEEWKNKPAKLAQKDRDALDHQIQQSQAEGGWRAAGGSRILPLERGLGWHLLVRAVPVTEMAAGVPDRRCRGGPPLLYTYKKKRNRFSLKRLNWSLLKARPKAPCPPDRARAEDVRSGFRHEINGFGVPTLSIQVHGRAREQDLQPPLV
jgi:hypothetical protein